MAASIFTSDALSGKVAVISGAARGMGAAVARRFAGAGAQIVIGDVRADEGEALAAELGSAALFVRLDVTSDASWKACAATAVDAFGGVDILISNAGILRVTPLLEHALEDVQAVINVNQMGVWLGMRTVAPLIAQRGGGAIVNTSSMGGLIGMDQIGAYVASKWAVRGMTKTAALELGPLGIRCNSVHPGYIETAMLTRDGERDPEELVRLGRRVPIGRVGTPDEVADVYLFLASDAGRYVSGAEIHVDGGLLAGIGTSPKR